MKKNTSRISKLLLACVPLLLASSITAHAEDNNLEKNSNNITTEVFSGTSNTVTNADSSTNPLPVSPISESIKATINGTGVIKLAQYRGVDLVGDFVPKTYNNITIDAKGNYVAGSIGEEEITIEFKPSAETLSELQSKFPNDVFSDTFRSLPIPVSVTNIESSSTTDSENSNSPATSTTTEDSSTDETSTSSTDDENKINVPLELVESSLKSTDGTLEVKVKDGEKVTGAFTAIDTDTFVLDTKGKYSIPEKSQDKVLKQAVKFTLDKESTEALAKLDAYKGKDIETTYDFNVTKQAQKNIILTFANNKITTTVNGTSRFILNDYEGIKIEGEFTPLTDNEFLSIDKLGNWKALKVGSGDFTPGFNVSDNTLKALQEKYPDTDLKITNEKVNVSITDSTGSSTTKKTYAPVSNLPKTGEEKLRFAGIIGVVLVAIVALLFFLKRKNNKDDE